MSIGGAAAPIKISYSPGVPGELEITMWISHRQSLIRLLCLTTSPVLHAIACSMYIICTYEEKRVTVFVNKRTWELIIILMASQRVLGDHSVLTSLQVLMIIWLL